MTNFNQGVITENPQRVLITLTKVVRDFDSNSVCGIGASEKFVKSSFVAEPGVTVDTLQSSDKNFPDKAPENSYLLNYETDW